MILRLVREVFSDKSTTGSLYVDGAFFCYTLEDRVRDVKIAGETCIPFGNYEVVITYSPKFKRELPLVKNVPGFDGIRIHPGNTDVHTHGCILVGDVRLEDRIEKSTAAFERLFARLKAAGKISLEIVEPDGG